MSDAKDKFHEITLAIPRFIIAIAIALTIAVPLELLIFNKEINWELQKEEQSTIDAAIKELTTQKENASESLVSRVKTLTDAIEEYQNNKTECTTSINELAGNYSCECDGTCGTGKKGYGSECKRKYILYSDKKSDCERLTGHGEKELQINKDELKDKQSQIQNIASEFEEKQKEIVEGIKKGFSYSLLARIKALYRLASEDNIIQISVTMIKILIMSVEISPLIVKLMSTNHIYEECLKHIRSTDFESIRKQRVKIHEEIDVLASEADKLLISAKKKGIEFSNSLLEKLNEVKDSLYLEVWQKTINDLRHDKRFTEIVFNDMKTLSMLAGTVSVVEDDQLPMYRHLFFGFTVLIILLLSIVIYLATGNNIEAVTKFLGVIFFLFNLFVFYKKFVKNKEVEQLPSF